MIKICLLQIYLSQMAPIFSIIAKPVIIFEVYKDLENVFSIKNASHLLLYKDYDYIIDLVDDKKPSNSPI